MSSPPTQKQSLGRGWGELPRGVMARQMNLGRSGVACVATMLLTALLLFSTAAYARVQVSGSRAAVIIQAENASFRDVISAINRQIKTRINLRGAVAPRITGTYIGTLSHALARMLDGYNYVMDSKDGVTALTILRPDARGGIPANKAFSTHASKYNKPNGGLIHWR
jgi:hypothetical protein